jgi:hypothetical protein
MGKPKPIKIPKGMEGSQGRKFSTKHGTLSLRLDKGWERYNSAVDVRNFKRAFARERRKALNAVAQTIVAEGIAKGSFEPNAALTAAIKGHSTSLLDRKKFLTKAIGTKIIDEVSVFVGVRKNHKNYRIAVGLHEGMTIPVTDAMRHMFLALAAVSSGRAPASTLTGRAKQLYRRKKKGWLPLSPSTKSIKIRGRPFIDAAFASPKARAAALRQFGDAVDATIRTISGNGRSGAIKVTGSEGMKF